MTETKTGCRPASGTGVAVSVARRRLLHGVAAILATGAAVVTTVVFAPNLVVGVASAKATGCPDVQIVFARGTGEDPGVGRVGQAFADSLRSQIPGRSVAVRAVDYPASHDFLQATDGANDASAFIEQVAATCPATKIVLGGYSQGAAVIDIVTVAAQPVLGFNSPMPADIADHVAAVAVFGNPSNRVGGPLTALSPLYGSKTIDLCNGGDPVCSAGDDVSAHSLYVLSGMASQAASFTAGLV